MFLHKHFVDKRTAGGEMEDIRRNLNHLLTSKQGCGSFLDDFGVTETGYRTPAEMVENLSREIRTTVARYEPRIEIIEIDEEHNNNGSVTLMVQCRLRSTDERLQILLNPARRLVDIGEPAPEQDDE